MSEPRALVVGVFEDEVRAEQAVRALEVWRSANRRAGIGPLAVVARRVSGTVTWRARGVLRPGRGALIGLLVGVVLLALPAAGAAGLAAYVLGTIIFGLAGLVGAVPSSQVGGMVVAVTFGSAALAALFAGLVGGLLGCLVGLVVGLIDGQARGLSGSEVAQTATSLAPGAWAAVARAQAPAAPLVRDELARLGGAIAVEPEPLPAAAPPAAAAPAAPLEAGSPAGPASSDDAVPSASSSRKP